MTKVLIRPPGNGDDSLVIPGFIVNYDDDTHKSTIVAYRPEGSQITLHGVPYDEDLPQKRSRSGFWCHFSDLKMKESQESVKTETAVESVQSM